MKYILLVQFRTDKSAFLEKDCFLRYFRGRRNLKLKIINVFNRKINFSLPQNLLNKTQGVILGGSGEFYLSGNGKGKEKIFQLMLKRISSFIDYLLMNDFPTLGICFGHQILAYFLGGMVIKDKTQAEAGSFLVFLNQQGKLTHLFTKMPSEFFAQFGHKDSLKDLPKDTKLLAKTKRCKVAAFQYKNNIYGVQFHPELNYWDMVSRFNLYPEYDPEYDSEHDGRSLKKVKKNLKPSPLAPRVIKNFLKLYTD